MDATPDTDFWWKRDDLQYDEHGKLIFDKVSVLSMAWRHGTPCFLYSCSRVAANIRRLKSALEHTGMQHQLLYALKANRFPPLLAFIRSQGIGLDVCSPGEVSHALDNGFELDQLSFTASNLSTADFRQLANWEPLWLNLDSLTAIRRIAEFSPGREIGLRINPSIGVGYADNPLVTYASSKPTKFGIHFDQFDEALDLASSLGLKVTGLHCHAGSGFLSPQLETYARMLEVLLHFLDRAPEVSRINLGGGLGVPLQRGDSVLDLDEWSNLVRDHLASRKLRLTIEPGDHIVKDAGILITEITQVEAKAGTTFIGVNAGFNIHPEPAFYQLPLEPVPVQRNCGDCSRVTIAGNINEALDLWNQDIDLPPVAEGDFLAFLNAGAYGSSMASQHCLRNQFHEALLPSGDVLRDLDASNQQAWESLYASTPDLVWGREPIPFLDLMRSQLCEHLSPGTQAVFLDAGTGEGRNLPFLLSMNPSEVIALDASSAALGKISPALRSRVSLKQATLDHTGLPTDSVDLVLMIDVAETLPCLSTTLKEIARILTPGGLLLCNFAAPDDGVAGIEMHPSVDNGHLYQGKYYFRFFDESDAERELQSAALKPISSQKISWKEAHHPGFRDEPHLHTSYVIIAQKST